MPVPTWFPHRCLARSRGAGWTPPGTLTLLVAIALVLSLSPAGASSPPRPEHAPAPGERRAEQVPDRYIVVYRAAVPDPRGKTDRLERARGFQADQRYSRALKGFAARLSGPQLAALAEDPDVELISPDRPVSISGAVPLASSDTAPYGVRRIGAATSETTREASSADVAIVDTGIDLDHPDLNAVDGVNCIGSGPAEDDHGHGTHVAGTVAAPNNGAGVTGVTPGTRVHAVKVLDSAGSGTWSQIICGIDWVTDTLTDADPANDIAVANLSLGGPGPAMGTCAGTADPLHRAICNSTDAGVTFVVAAGNSGWDFDYPSNPNLPAAYPEVLTVSAIADSDGLPGGAGGSGCDTRQSDDTYASFSNFAATPAGAAHLVAAPGSCIMSTRLGGTYAMMSGTSMAAPHVAGLVALCFGEGAAPGPCAGLAPAQIIDKVRSDAQARTTSDAAYGFAGDPVRPVTGRSYGYLAWAGETNTASPAANARYNALSPSRILDTRSGNGAPAAKVSAGQALDLQVSGRGGVPTTGVSAVALNVTVTEPSAAGSVTAWPAGQPRPETVSVSHAVNQTIAGLVVVGMGSGGKVSLSNSKGQTHAIADVVGWYGDDTAVTGSRFNPLVPSRILDTRSGNGAPVGQLGAGATHDLQVSGRGGVPTTGASAVVLNMTVASPTTGSHLTVWPTGQTRPTASNLNYINRQTVANLVIAKVDPAGQVSIYNNQGEVHVIADVVGWFGEDGGGLGALYGALVPERILDTRSGNGAPAAKLGPGATLDLQVSGRGGVPATGVTGTVITVTASDATTGSHLTVWPTGQPRPTASNLNFTRGGNVSNSVAVPVGAEGKVSIFNNGGEVHVSADVAGWYSP